MIPGFNLKRCKKCKEGFDIGTNQDLCVECRLEINEVVKNGDTKTR